MMRKIYDGKLYFVFGIVTLAIAAVLGGISSYSYFYIEPKVSSFLESETDIEENYKNAYLILRNPQIFAGYEHFDGEGVRIKKIIESFDKLIYSGFSITPDNKSYLEILLDRRKAGRTLGYKTMLFVLGISLLSWIMLFIEKRQGKTES